MKNPKSLGGYVSNIPGTYSCIINAQTPAVTKQTSAATKQIHTTAMRKPATTKLLSTANLQTLAAIEQMLTATA
ncbi:hypothetical protein DSO57_1037895 [Entomophthora muscae]|uniref:Uncharacterized protein n=2 Tax=Entomophthora muscae TaxID=34485 RepID=A0ACC2SBV1_9FUNG|nr:hypothetical protein DSO57_1029173 [Entomophthora muscae]KAJ9059785.1 hypothetical protein DSO57_1037895 [Entomophthora muscae]